MSKPSDPHVNTPPLSIGTLFAAERKRKNLTIERAAKDTRIQRDQLKQLEEDDLSTFDSPSYARLFYVAYAKYLGISPERYRHLLPDLGTCSAEGYQYLNSFAKKHDPRERAKEQWKPHRPPKYQLPLVKVALWLVAACGVGLLVMGTFVIINLTRLTPSPASTANATKQEDLLLLDSAPPPPVEQPLSIPNRFDSAFPFDPLSSTLTPQKTAVGPSLDRDKSESNPSSSR